jgi:hypothetical protein
MTDNSILARAKAEVETLASASLILKTGLCEGAIKLLRDIIAALEEPDEATQTASMLRTYGPEIFGPPNEQGQVHFGQAVMDSAADLIERQRLQLAEAERKLREAEEHIRKRNVQDGIAWGL